MSDWLDHDMRVRTDTFVGITLVLIINLLDQFGIDVPVLYGALWIAALVLLLRGAFVHREVTR